MHFSDPMPDRGNLTLLPMINVVFLLVIFFLLAGELRPADPLAVAPPEIAAGDQPGGWLSLSVAEDGRLGFGNTVGEDAGPRSDDMVIAALVSARAGLCAGADCTLAPPGLILRADRKLDAARVARLLPVLAQIGFSDIRIEGVARGADR